MNGSWALIWMVFLSIPVGVAAAGMLVGVLLLAHQLICGSNETDAGQD